LFPPRFDHRSFEPEAFGRWCRGARELDDKKGCPEMAPQRLEKIESGLGNGMVSEASEHKIWYTGARLTVRSD